MAFNPFDKNKDDKQQPQQQQQSAGVNPPADQNPPQPPEGNNENKPPEGKITGTGWRAKVNCTFKGKLVREGEIVPDAGDNPNFELV
jgi:hypothetical protein